MGACINDGSWGLDNLAHVSLGFSSGALGHLQVRAVMCDVLWAIYRCLAVMCDVTSCASLLKIKTADAATAMHTCTLIHLSTYTLVHLTAYCYRQVLPTTTTPQRHGLSL
jgi:hypothetical protein